MMTLPPFPITNPFDYVILAIILICADILSPPYPDVDWVLIYPIHKVLGLSYFKSWLVVMASAAVVLSVLLVQYGSVVWLLLKYAFVVSMEFVSTWQGVAVTVMLGAALIGATLFLNGGRK